MDLMSGLTAASQAIQIVKDIRGIDRSIDEATFKLKLAELTEALAETKVALSEARLTLSMKDEEIAELKQQLSVAGSGESCPVCKVGALRVTAVRNHPSLWEVGVQERDLECSNEACRHRERRAFDPMGILKK